MTQSDEQTRDPEAVLRFASAGGPWAVWHPGDGSQYRVSIVPIVGGPDHADRVLLVAIGGKTIAVQFTSPHTDGAQYRVRKWTNARWKLEGAKLGEYDPWEKVVLPLLKAAGVA